jgi:hypothetical protein
MSIFRLISTIFAPAAKLIDDLHTSDEEKLTLANKLTTIQNEMHSKVIDYETKILESKTAIITAEANGQSWLQRSWRPITMLTFLGLVVFDSFGWLANPLAPEAWTLLQIGLGGYVAGRSLEKVVERAKK